VTVAIITDSASDIPAALADELGIIVVPLHVRFGTTELMDRVELGSEKFWERCAASTELPQTAAPSPGAFEEAFRFAHSRGAQAAVCVTLSAKLSATGEAASQAARAVSGELSVQVVDSASVTMGEGLVAVEAAEAARAGGSLDDVVAAAVSARGRTRVFGLIDTLDNLKRGGRIGGAAAALGTLLSIKPVIEVRRGMVEQESRQRTRARSMRYLAAKVTAAAPLERLAVLNTNASDFEELVEMLSGVPVTVPLVVGEIGPVVATHAGPGAIGAAWLEPAGGGRGHE
jgi:DegV family protein with EDD domain